MENLDLAKGILVSELPDGSMKHGRVGEVDVIVVRSGEEFFAVAANCTHYGGPLAQGLVAGDQIRCPLHHACFSLRTGKALRAPAFDSIGCWRVERIRNTLFVREKVDSAPPAASTPADRAKFPKAVVIVGGGGAGFAAADALRNWGYDGPVTILSADDSAPVDRPNLSKDYLTGQAQPDWIPLRPPEYFADHHIDLVLNARVSSLDTRQKRVQVQDGRSYEYDALLLATGADPVKISVPGVSENAVGSQLFYLRSFADSKALLDRAQSAAQVVVVGASFIGLEVAASLRERGLRIYVVAPEEQPLERALGREVGSRIRLLHESHGTVFRLGQTVTRFDGKTATLSGGEQVDADFLVLGVGVRPSVALAQQAGLKVDRGIVVNEYLETSAPGVFAAGDVAQWPNPISGQLTRVEHWVFAERQGQIAARNMLGSRERFLTVPFFWTAQFGATVRYIGHAEKWDQVEIDGSLDDLNCTVTYKVKGRQLAVATIGRDLVSLQAEVAMEAAIRLEEGL
jgi:3-phenylpropionate/trans-cinnamate dioxygenase ferredoxin reductase subunit